MSEAMPATGIAGILAAPGSCARPSRAVPPGSVAELSCQKIIFDLQLADLPVQVMDLGLIGVSLRRSTTLEDACRTVQQLLLPVVDLVRVDPELPSQLGDGPVAPGGRQRHLRLERRAVLLPCPLHILLPRYPRFLGAGLHLSHLSHFRGPAQFTCFLQKFLKAERLCRAEPLLSRAEYSGHPHGPIHLVLAPMKTWIAPMGHPNIVHLGRATTDSLQHTCRTISETAW